MILTLISEVCGLFAEYGLLVPASIVGSALAIPDRSPGRGVMCGVWRGMTHWYMALEDGKALVIDPLSTS